jgi:hypothetical protein
MLILVDCQDRFTRPTLARKALGSNSLLAGFPTGASLSSDDERAPYYSGSSAEMKQVQR